MAKRVSKFATIKSDHPIQETVRIDKWLWAARFFKTRSLAKAAIEGGKVHVQGERVKVSKDVRIGMLLTIQQGAYKKTVEIKGLSEIRGSAPIAQQLYEETAESIEQRETLAAQRKLAMTFSPFRPTKKDRRAIQKFQHYYDNQDHDEWDEEDTDDLEHEWSSTLWDNKHV